jgi:uroporphyrinogen decarboxylase
LSVKGSFTPRTDVRNYPMLENGLQPNFEGLLSNLRREGTPNRVYHMELFLDQEVHQALHIRFGVAAHLDHTDPHYQQRALISLYRFLGYDIIRPPLGGLQFPHLTWERTTDTAPLTRMDGRGWRNDGRGTVSSWEDFERYPWPDPNRFDTSELEWYSANLPDDMCLAGSCHPVFETTCNLMGFETLAYALYDQPDLVSAVLDRVGTIFLAAANVYTQFDRVKILFDGDDMGFHSGTLINPQTLIETVLPWHKKITQVAHDRGLLYLLHSCGNVAALMPSLIEDVKIDGRHSFEDKIEPVTEAKRRWGDHIALIGGIDVDFLTRAKPEQVRQRVRETLDACLPGGGYCLGSGNSVTNYIPLDNFLAMVDEGRRYSA